MRVSILNIDFSHLGLYMKYVTPSVGSVIQAVKCMGRVADLLYLVPEHYPLETILPFLIVSVRRYAVHETYGIALGCGLGARGLDSFGWSKKLNDGTGYFKANDASQYANMLIVGITFLFIWWRPAGRIPTFFAVAILHFIMENIVGIKHSFSNYFERYIYSKDEVNTRYLSLVYFFSLLLPGALSVALSIVSYLSSLLVAGLTMEHTANITMFDLLLWTMGIGAVASAYLLYFVK
jgi:hypothetical protein